MMLLGGLIFPIQILLLFLPLISRAVNLHRDDYWSIWQGVPWKLNRNVTRVWHWSSSYWYTWTPTHYIDALIQITFMLSNGLIPSKCFFLIVHTKIGCKQDKCASYLLDAITNKELFYLRAAWWLESKLCFQPVPIFMCSPQCPRGVSPCFGVCPIVQQLQWLFLVSMYIREAVDSRFFVWDRLWICHNPVCNWSS